MTASNHDSLRVAVGAAGEAWASDCADTLREEGRAIAGGWPGTMTEARLRAAACAAEQLGTPVLAPDLLDGLARPRLRLCEAGLDGAHGARRGLRSHSPDWRKIERLSSAPE